MVKDLTLRLASRAKFKPVISEKKIPNFRLNNQAFKFNTESKWIKPENLEFVDYLHNRSIVVEEISLRGLPSILSSDSLTPRVSILFPEPPSMQGWDRDDIRKLGFEVTHLLYRNLTSELENFLISEFGVAVERSKTEFMRNTSGIGNYFLIPFSIVNSVDQCNLLLGVNKRLIYGNFRKH